MQKCKYFSVKGKTCKPKVVARHCNKTARRPLISVMNDTEKTRNSYTHVLKYTGVFGGVQGLNIIIGLVRSKLVAVILGPAGMGLASLLNTVANFVSQATNLGISFSAVKHLSEIFDSGDEQRIQEFVKTVRAWSMVAALAGAAVCMAASPLLAGYAFGGEGHAWQVMALAPTVAAMALTGGETAILKGARRLRELAKTQVMLVVMSLAIAVPIYLLMGIGGIIPVITLTALAALVVTARFSLRLYPLSLRCARRTLGEGTDMVRLGLAFIMSGVFGSGAEMIVRSFLNTAGGLDIVGLYNAGYVLTVTYAGMVFTAMETDYFPRLSAVNHDTEAVNTAANRQIEVTLLIIAPMLTFMLAALPRLIPLLYSGKFTPVTGMAQAAVLAMFAKAFTTPLEYITLAKGHSKAYLALEFAFDAAFAILVIMFFRWWGLTGTGFGLLAAYMANTVMIYLYAHIRYKYRVSKKVLAYAGIQFPIGVAAYACTFIDDTLTYIATEAAATIASTAVSLYILYKNTSAWDKIKMKCLKKR